MLLILSQTECLSSFNLSDSLKTSTISGYEERGQALSKALAKPYAYEELSSNVQIESGLLRLEYGSRFLRPVQNSSPADHDFLMGWAEQIQAKFDSSFSLGWDQWMQGRQVDSSSIKVIRSQKHAEYVVITPQGVKPAFTWEEDQSLRIEDPRLLKELQIEAAKKKLEVVAIQLSGLNEAQTASGNCLIIAQPLDSLGNSNKAAADLYCLPISINQSGAKIQPVDIFNNLVSLLPKIIGNLR